MDSIQRVHSRKYETLGSLMADYLENLLYSRESSSEGSIEGGDRETVLNVHELRTKDVKEWSFE